MPLVDNEEVVDEDHSGHVTAIVDLAPVQELVRPPPPQKVNVIAVAKCLWIWILAVFANFVVTLAIFPAIAALVESTDRGSGHAWNDKYFNPVGCFLLYNVGDYVGRILASYIQWPRNTAAGAHAVLLFSLLRLAFVPLFVLCNASPLNRHMTKVVFDSDAAFLLLMCIFSVSGGYLGTIIMMFAPKVRTT